MNNKTPFPWFGGKSRAAELIWSRIGSDCKNYIEPFFGSGAVLLNRPDEYDGWITINDLDGHVANFWRAMQCDPSAVALHANNPVNECDLHARHLHLVSNVEKLSLRLMADPDYYDSRIAGWWAWGACCWIGSGWCNRSGSWGAVDVDGVLEFMHLGRCTGVNRPLPHLGNGGTGVNRKLPHLGGGQGVNRQREDWLSRWFAELSDSLRDVRVACGDWSRIMSVGTMARNGICGVVLDPPYSLTTAVYARDSTTVSSDVRKWCIENGNNQNLRIALCGHDTEHNALESLGWRVETWDKAGGYQGSDDRERIWFSPNCLGIEKLQQDLFA